MSILTIYSDQIETNVSIQEEMELVLLCRSVHFISQKNKSAGKYYKRGFMFGKFYFGNWLDREIEGSNY